MATVTRVVRKASWNGIAPAMTLSLLLYRRAGKGKSLDKTDDGRLAYSSSSQLSKRCVYALKGFR